MPCSRAWLKSMVSRTRESSDRPCSIPSLPRTMAPKENSRETNMTPMVVGMRSTRWLMNPNSTVSTISTVMISNIFTG